MNMGKFNPKKTISNRLTMEKTRTVNYEGAEAFLMTPKAELYGRVVTCLLEPKFYDNDSSDTKEAIVSLVKQMEEIDPEFVLKLASYARNEMYLRSVPMMLLVEACKYPKMKTYVRKYAPYIIRRVDEITEVLAYYIKQHGHIGDEESSGMLCNALKKGIADSFHNFDEYGFAKYNRKGVVSLKDALRITHPKPNNKEESDLFKRIIEDNLRTPDTWETHISGKGSTKETWEEIIPKMPIMATIRNLRNMAKVGADVSSVMEKLTNPDIIKRSNQFPFRFYSAYKMLEESGLSNVTPLLEALEKAIEISIDNLPMFGGVTFSSADNSGSMTQNISKRSIIKCLDIANLLQAILHKRCGKCIASVFGTDFAVVPVTKNNTVFTNMEKFMRTDVGHSTNGFKVIKYLLDNKLYIDRLILLSDLQLWQTYDYGDMSDFASLWRKYKSTVNKNAILYSIDLVGYGTLKTPEKDTYLIAGWSEKIINFIELNETSGESTVKYIEEYSPF